MRSISFDRKLLLFAIFLIAGSSASAQLLDQHARDTARVYSSIERAMKNPDQVYVLDLKKNKLKEFPMEVLQFKNLNVLVLSHNKLIEVPDQLAELEYLQELSFGKNKLRTWPASICKLIHLKRLDLSQNYIEAIPKEIEQLQELEVLDLWSNELYFFPDEMAEMESLRWMDLSTIQLNVEEQQRIAEMLPQVNIAFSTPCNCGY